MATNTTEIRKKKIRSDTIQALEMVLATIKNCEEISDANFWAEPEWDESIKNNSVWLQKYSTGWHNLSIELRYKIKNSGDCCGKKEMV